MRFLNLEVRRIKNDGLPSDFGAAERELWHKVKPFTMTSPERVIALREAVKYVETACIPGAIVECGVWRGGSMMVVANALKELGKQRSLYLYDTFEGMTAPTDDDVSKDGAPAFQKYESSRRQDGSSGWCLADLTDVRNNLLGTGYPESLITFVKGPVEETIPKTLPSQIALLRLDTDWYESTKWELEHLYPRLAPGGVLIIDDYGHWQGARKAVDEYIATNRLNLLLTRVDYSGRLAVKPFSID